MPFSAAEYEQQARVRAPEFSPNPDKKIAAIVTTYFRYSHADDIVTRFLEGYAIVGRSYPTPCRVASMFMDQTAEADIGRPFARHYKVPMYDTIAEALTLGGKELAVDGVLIIGEHGKYPFNDKGQHLYPRRAFFEQVLNVFRASGRAVPVYTDKHLSYDWEGAKWMYDQSRALGFPLMAGSSVPLGYRHPEVQPALGVKWDTALSVGYGGFESYGFHALEALQCMTERREGGETGVRAVQCLEGPASWEAAKAGRWDRRLVEAAIAGSPTRRDGPLEEVDAEAIVYLIEYRDGLHAAAYMARRSVADFCFAGRVKDHAEPLAYWIETPKPHRDHFSFLSHHIGRMYVTGKESYPVERTLLTGGMLTALVDSKAEGHRRVETPHLDIRYQAAD